jgi:hypothetical protein
VAALLFTFSPPFFFNLSSRYMTMIEGVSDGRREGNERIGGESGPGQGGGGYGVDCPYTYI